MNTHHQHTPARVQVYHGRRQISKQKKIEKPKSHHTARGLLKKCSACQKRKSRYQHAATKILVKDSPTGGGLQKTPNEIEPGYPEIIFKHYLRIEETNQCQKQERHSKSVKETWVSKKINGNKCARHKVSTMMGDLEGALEGALKIGGDLS